MPNDFTVIVSQKISRKRISDLLCSALEGGSNYWYTIKEFREPTSFEFQTDEETKVLYRHLDYPLNPGGALVIRDILSDQRIRIAGKRFKEYTLDLEAIKKGLQIFSDKYPVHYANFINENDDAETGDVFLQCCLFGMVIYG